MRLVRWLAAAALLAALLAGARAAPDLPADQGALPGGPDDVPQQGPSAAAAAPSDAAAAGDESSDPASASAAAADDDVTDGAPDAGLALGGEEDQFLSSAAADLAAKNAEAAMAPHPTVEYDARSEYGGFEYAGPVRTPRHVVLDTHAKCAAYGNPAQVFTLDQRGYGFRGLGAFVLYRTANGSEEVQVLETRTPAPQSVQRVVAAGIRSGNRTLQVSLARLRSQDRVEDSLVPYISVDGADQTQFVMQQEVFAAPGGAFEISRDGLFGGAKPMILAVRLVGSLVTVAVTFERTAGVHHLNVFVEVSAALLQRTEGLCGLFDLDPGNDLAVVPGGADGHPVASASETGLRWAVTRPRDALFEGYAVPEGEPLVVPAALQPADLLATATMLADAERECQGARRDFRLPCIMNTLLGGREGRAEVAGAQEILLENSVVATPNMTQCLANFFLAPWTAFGACDSACGEGTINRTRTVYDGETRRECGKLTQYRKCVTVCEHVALPAKCAAFGDPHFVTFDQKMYDFRGVGEYVLYHSLDDREQVNVVLDRLASNRTSLVSWVTGAAFRLGPDVFSAHMPDPSDDALMLRYNGRLIGGLPSDVSYFGLFTVRKSGSLRGGPRTNLVVEVTVPGGTTVSLVFYKLRLASLVNVFVTVNGQRIQQTQGLCGSYDFKPDNDLTDAAGRASTPREFGWSWAVDRNRTLFGDPVPAGALPASSLPVSPLLIGGQDGSFQRAVNACAPVPAVLRDACVLDTVTLGDDALRMIRDVDVVVDEDKVSVQYVAQGCLVAEGSYLGPWDEWTPCSRACNGGLTTRKRGVFAYTTEQCSTVSEQRECNTQPCPVDCEVGPWRDWAACSVTCGNGTETRTRGIVVETAHGGAECPELMESRPCVRLPCCEVGNWTDFEPCRPDGTQVRTRAVNFPSRCGATTDTRECCYADPWPVAASRMNGTRAPGLGGEPLWSECKDGEQVRRRRVFPEHCAVSEERRPCCESGAWSDWGSCVDGIQTRWRTVSPNNCTHSAEHRVCCTQYAWSGWGPCVKGSRNRTRDVLPLGCDTTVQYEACCHFGDWVNTTDCVLGTQTFRREVDPPACGKAVKQESCCSAGEWSDWSECGKRGGNQTRTRKVYGPKDCLDAREVRPCPQPPEYLGCRVGPRCPQCPCQLPSAQAECGCSRCPCHAPGTRFEPVYADTVLPRQAVRQGAMVIDGDDQAAAAEVKPRTVPAGSLLRRLL